MAGMPPEAAPAGAPRRRKLGTRRRRLRRTVALLAVLAALFAAVGWLVYHFSRPPVRRPGEDLPDITTKLSQGVSENAPEPLWTDVTRDAGLAGFRTFAGPRSSQLPEDMGAGAAWGDYDNDGDEDLFLVSAGGNLDQGAAGWPPSLLFENLGDGTFRRDDRFPDTRISGMAAAWGDYDNDGWLDLVVTGYRALLLFHNDGGRLSPAPALPAPDGYWAGAAWGDFDNDRDLDLYVCGYVAYRAGDGGSPRASQQYGAAVPFTLNPASFEPQPNLLLENRGDGRFEEVALLHGVSNPGGRSLGALWHDFDADGRLDLYVANDISDNALFLQRDDGFEDVSLRALVADYRGAMGLAAGDWNRDGDDDLFITHWIAQENALYDSRLNDSPPADGGPRRLVFSDLSAPLGLGQIALPMVGWGTELADFDADGWLDLVVSNGSTFEDDGQPKKLVPQLPFLFWNRHGERFENLAPGNPALAVPHVGRGLALADYDQDGDLDLLLVHLDAGVQLLRNDMATGHQVQVRLRNRGPRADSGEGFGDGSTVIAQVGDATLRRTVGGASYLSQSSRTLHFGLGAAQRIDRLEVHWLGGETESYGPLAAGGLWQIREGDPEPRLLAGEPARTRHSVTAFWEAHRAAMDAMKREGDLERAIVLFRRALALDPSHEDARYYLANCLAATGEPAAALDELDRLRRQNPQSQRAQLRWAVLRAVHATSEADLAAAEAAAERALEINREETGSLLLLGELALIRGDDARAEQRLALACRTNPRAAGGFFLRAFIAHRAGRDDESRDLLLAVRQARGKDWKPAGAVSEGEVKSRMHDEDSPLSASWQAWNGEADPATAFTGVERRLAALQSFSASPP